MSRVVTNSPRYQGLAYFATNAVGNESKEIEKYLRQFFDALQSNVISIRPRLEAVSELFNLYRECSHPDWDGEGALPISAGTIQEAAKFLSALPLTLRTPEIVPEPSGAIGFEWRFGPNAVFVASVHGTQEISYAGLFGPGITAYGTEAFADSIPDTIVMNLQRLREAR